MENITITREEFRDAILKANEEFTNVGKKAGDEAATANLMMGIQNVLFGSLLETVLFADKKEEN
jgi:hypothetical protein